MELQELREKLFTQCVGVMGTLNEIGTISLDEEALARAITKVLISTRRARFERNVQATIDSAKRHG